jgi:ssDNA-binding Zn-finger/Zn-ribbon topoisomerase 1
MIFPLRPQVTAEHIAALDDNEAKIYELIRCRALASQMKAAVGEHFKVEIGVGPEAFFTTQFRSVSEKGFLAVYLGRYDKSLREENPLVALKEGQNLNIIKLIPEQTGGMAAEHYTLETLFADLSEFASVADPGNIFMLQGMINSGYIVVAKDGYLTLGDHIKKVTSILSKAFPHMQGINLSAYIEQTIAEATTGRKGLDSALKQFDQALIFQGRPLIKAILPSMIKSRTRRSSTIIKQVSAEQTEEIVQASTPQAAVSVDVEMPQGEPVEQVEQVVATEAREGGDTVEAVDEDAVAGPQAGAAVEEIMAETLEEPAFLDEEESDEWPEELQKAFEAALQESDTEDAARQAAPAAAPVSQMAAEKSVETDQGHCCQVCGKAMLLKEDRFGKFWSCSGFPGCRHTEAFNRDAQVMYCPICREGEIVNKRTPSGKPFYVCIDPDCEFMSWAKPHYASCQVCDSQYLVEKKSSSGKMVLCCPKAGCDYSQPLVGEGSVVGEVAKPAKRKVRVRRKVGSAPLGSGGGKKLVRVVRRKKA